MSDRRAFLRSLASLPLIGGGITLIGRPTQVAQPATNEQLAKYMAIVFCELDDTMRHFHRLGPQAGNFRLESMIEKYHAEFPARSDVALRAPLVLSAAGVPLSGVAHG